MGIVLANNAHTTLAANINSTDTTIYVDDVDSFPSLGVDEYFYCTIESTTGTYEIVKVTQTNSTSFLVERGQEGTIAVPFNIGARVELRITVQNLEDHTTTIINDAIGNTVQGYDPDLSIWAGLTPSADAQELIKATNYATIRGLLNLEVGTDFYSIAATDAAIAAVVSDTAYNEASWNGVDTIAPSKNAVRDKVVLVDALLNNITRGATFASEGDLFTALGADFWRNGERALFGGYASQYKGTNDRADGASFLGTTGGGFNAFWLERSAQLGALSLHGGIGLLGGARKSDRYIYTDGTKYSVWAASTVYAPGAIVGSRGKFYQTVAGGTSGATPPSHTTGDASDGAVTWTFLDYSYTAPIGVAGAVLSDVVDGSGAWASYFESVKTANGGTTYGTEWDVGNEGSNIVSNPYDISPAGATLGLWIAAGRSASTPANPSTAAITIGSNNQTWNTGINFQSTGITSGGYAMKMAADASHSFGWFNSSGQQVSLLRSAGTANNERTQLLFGDRKIELYAVGGVMAAFQSGAAAGTAADEHVNLIAYAAGTGYAEVRAQGTATNLDLLLAGKGSGLPRAATLYASTSIELGHASDTTLTRSASGILAVEGVDQVGVSNAQTISGTKTFSATPVFSNASTGISINSTSPRILWTDTDATATQQVWDMVASNASWLFRTRSDADGAGSTIMTVTRSGTNAGAVSFNAPVTVSNNAAIPAGGTAGLGVKVSSTTNFGVFFGSGAPTLSAAKGSLYLRSDGSGTNGRMYVNTDGSTTWTAVVTVA